MVKIPTAASEVTQEWFTEVMKESDKEILDVEVTQFHREGLHENGMLSSIIRISAKTNNHEEEKKYFLKVLPPDEVHREFVTQSFMDITEIQTYKVLFRDLTDFERKHSKNKALNGVESLIPKLISADYCLERDKRGCYLLLEDLSDNFEMKDFNEGLTSDQVIKSLEALAQFHATTFAFKKVEKIAGFTQKYDFLSSFFEKFETDPDIKAFMDSNMEMLQADVDSSADLKHLSNQVKRVRVEIGRKYGEKLRQPHNNKWRQFLTQGDIWSNNVLFGVNNEVKMVDWQFTGEGEVYLDFGTLAYISMNPEETEKNLDLFIKSYFDKFHEICDNFEVEIPWGNLQEFSREVQQFGLYLTFMWCSTSYELTKKYPKMKERVFWVLKKSIKLTPTWYQ